MLRGRFSLGKDLMKGLILTWTQYTLLGPRYWWYLILALYFNNAGHLFQHYLSKRQCTFHLKKKYITQNNKSNSQIWRSSVWCRTKIFDLDHAAKVIWLNIYLSPLWKEMRNDLMVFETTLDQDKPAFPRILIFWIYTYRQQNAVCQRFFVQLNLYHSLG